MSNRKTLILLIALVVGTGGGRYWAQNYRKTWDDSFVDHSKLYRSVIGKAREVSARREAAIYGLVDGSGSYQTQIQEFAGKAKLGNVTARPRGRADQGDYTLNIEFQDTEHRFGRNQIFSFLYNCEVMIPRMRTKQFTMRPVVDGMRKVDPGVDREDLWKVEQLTFVKRSPERKDN